jgi:hypothetical protein
MQDHTDHIQNELRQLRFRAALVMGQAASYRYLLKIAMMERRALLAWSKEVRNSIEEISEAIRNSRNLPSEQDV